MPNNIDHMTGEITKGNIIDALIFRHYKAPMLSDQSNGKILPLIKLKKI